MKFCLKTVLVKTHVIWNFFFILHKLSGMKTNTVKHLAHSITVYFLDFKSTTSSPNPTTPGVAWLVMSTKKWSKTLFQNTLRTLVTRYVMYFSSYVDQINLSHFRRRSCSNLKSPSSKFTFSKDSISNRVVAYPTLSQRQNMLRKCLLLEITLIILFTMFLILLGKNDLVSK